MVKATRTYSQWRLEKLSDPIRAARYLNAAKKDSREALLHALKNVIQANQVSKIAKEAGISRESVYRSFSAEGNPTFDTLSDVLEALNIDYIFSANDAAISEKSGPETGRLEAEIAKANIVKTGDFSFDLSQAINTELVSQLPLEFSLQAEVSTVMQENQFPWPEVTLGGELTNTMGIAQASLFMVQQGLDKHHEFAEAIN